MYFLELGFVGFERIKRMSDVMMYRCEKDKKDVRCSDVQA
jgi:hypothetical protein